MKELFSESENKVLDILEVVGPMQIKEIAIQFYGRYNNPLDCTNRISGFIRRIVAKCEYHQLDWTIAGEGRGRLGRTVWIQTKEKRMPSDKGYKGRKKPAKKSGGSKKGMAKKAGSSAKPPKAKKGKKKK